MQLRLRVALVAGCRGAMAAVLCDASSQSRVKEKAVACVRDRLKLGEVPACRDSAALLLIKLALVGIACRGA